MGDRDGDQLLRFGWQGTFGEYLLAQCLKGVVNIGRELLTKVGQGSGRLGIQVGHDGLPSALSEQQQCVRGQHRSPIFLSHKSMPLGQCGRASVLVNVTGDEMALLIEMVVDLGVN